MRCLRVNWGRAAHLHLASFVAPASIPIWQLVVRPSPDPLTIRLMQGTLLACEPRHPGTAGRDADADADTGELGPPTSRDSGSLLRNTRRLAALAASAVLNTDCPLPTCFCAAAAGGDGSVSYRKRGSTARGATTLDSSVWPVFKEAPTTATSGRRHRCPCQ
jgi:hypothetical protein